MGIALSFCVMISRVPAVSPGGFLSVHISQHVGALRHPILLGRLDGLTASWGNKETDQRVPWQRVNCKCLFPCMYSYPIPLEVSAGLLLPAALQ